MTYDPQGLGEQFVHQADMFGYVPAMTQCNWCERVIPLRDAVVSTHHITPQVTEQEHYCCEDHALAVWNTRG